MGYELGIYGCVWIDPKLYPLEDLAELIALKWENPLSWEQLCEDYGYFGGQK